MSISLMIFIGLALVLVLLLAWAVRPPKRSLHSVDEVLSTLSEKRHYARLPQILQCLREEDGDFLSTRGRDDLATRVRRERKRIALRYLDHLEDEYQLLLEASQILARTAPEVSAMDELQRFRLAFRFVFWSRYLRWRLRFGLQPWDAFGILSDMEGDMTLHLEVAAARIGERAAVAAEFPLFLQDRGGDPR
jgi:hypothetical protein